MSLTTDSFFNPFKQYYWHKLYYKNKLLSLLVYPKKGIDAG